jgi:DNA-binding NtrC family response regulator
LNVITINLPPLRDRTDDLPVLLNHYINYFSEENGLEPIRISEGAMKILREYHWPGNIRELRNFCENNVVLKRGSELTEYDLDPKYSAKGPEVSSAQSASILPSSPTLSREDNEKRLLRSALIKANGNRTRAAELMGVSRRTLHRKLAQWPELDV